MRKLILSLMLAVGFCGGALAVEVPADVVCGDADRACAFDVLVEDDGSITTNSYTLSEFESAKAYLEDYKHNVMFDKKEATDRETFRAHEKEALATVHEREPLYGTWWALLPPLIAILLALITKEVYSSLFIGIVSGGALYSVKALQSGSDHGFFATLLEHVSCEGFIAQVTDADHAGIVIFLVLLGSLVAMMNKTGASAAFGRWAQRHIKTKVGAQIATILLGMLIFVDDYFNCLTVGSVMRPVTDAKKVSRAKLAYLIDATAAPICIIAPISSWAAAVASYATAAGAASGMALFVAAIPYNFYAILTILMMFLLSWLGFDFGAMRKNEQAAAVDDDTSGVIGGMTECLAQNSKGRVYDLAIPVVVLVVSCILGLVYTGGFFSGTDFVTAFSDSSAAKGLVYGSLVTVVLSIAFYLCRGVISFRDCMDAVPEGFKAMVSAILILCCAWTLNGMTAALGIKVFISDIINGPAAMLQNFLPAIIFVIAIGLAFSTGTSWGTFGILIPIVLAAIPNSQMTIVAVSACMAGAVCGDHCSPISDTTIMASAGAQCNHVVHVNTQLPYAMFVAAVSFVAYLIAPFVQSVWIALPVAIVLMVVAVFLMKKVCCERGVATPFPILLHKFAQNVDNAALAKGMERMAKAILADDRLDSEEAERLLKMIEGVEGAEAFRKALEDARREGVITMEESSLLESNLRGLVKRKA